ncbi:MAG: alpha/beta fold hydrolase [Moraxellaceae bacterium]
MKRRLFGLRRRHSQAVPRPVPGTLAAELTCHDSHEVLRLLTHDGYTLVGQWWLPQGAPRGVILVVHGTVMNAGFYKDWARHVTGFGYAVFGIDLRSWGQSQGRGVRGLIKHFKEYLLDVETAAAHVRERFPGVPFFLQGESLGGGVVLMADISGRVPNDGLILNAPAVIGNPGFGFLRAPQFFTNFCLDVLSRLAHLWPTLPFLPPHRWAIGMVFVDAKATQRFFDDPHNTRSWVPLFYITQTNKLMKHVRKYADTVKSPLLILHGTNDRLVPLRSSQWLLARATSEDKTLKVYRGLSHAALHVEGNQLLWADTIQWLEERGLSPDSTPDSERLRTSL